MSGPTAKDRRIKKIMRMLTADQNLKRQQHEGLRRAIGKLTTKEILMLQITIETAIVRAGGICKSYGDIR